MALPRALLSGAVDLCIAWTREKASPRVMCEALLELAACAATAAKIPEGEFSEMARRAFAIVPEDD
jgi:hypothetical protein